MYFEGETIPSESAGYRWWTLVRKIPRKSSCTRMCRLSKKSINACRAALAAEIEGTASNWPRAESDDATPGPMITRRGARGSRAALLIVPGYPRSCRQKRFSCPGRDRPPYVAGGLHPHSVALQFHAQNRSYGIGGLGFDVAAMQADVSERRPGVNSPVPSLISALPSRL
jgi:hypothetical protein